jgi:uncharacterized phage infection (PIP) family protein YhgE
MVREHRIVALGANGDEAVGEPADEALAPLDLSEQWQAEEPEPEFERPRRMWLAPLVAIVAIVAWTAFFAWANLGVLRSGSPAQWSALASTWALPVVLIAVVWLLAMRSSRREAMRFGDAARLLGAESARLEERLTTVNRELSLAREFLSAQSRELDSVGRVAAERISQHADRLHGLVRDNSAQVEAIANVSTTALDNMERLRGQLPVIASSAKDVTNHIGNAGRTAHVQLQDMMEGFRKLNEYGAAGERHVAIVKSAVDAAIAEFSGQAEQLGAIAQHRFQALAERGEAFRGELESHEVEALAAIRSRAAALSEELDEARRTLDGLEAESLTSLRARLTAVRDEGAAVARSLRDGESGAVEVWSTAIARLESDLRARLTTVDQLDQQTAAAARNRVEELAEEARRIDEKLVERNQHFAKEMERRDAQAEARHQAALSSLNERLAELDRELKAREERVAANEEMVAQGLRGRLEAIDNELHGREERVAESEDSFAQALRDRLVALDREIAARREATARSEAEAIDALNARLATLDDRITERRTGHEEQTRVILAHGAEIEATLSRFDAYLRDISDHGASTEASVSAGLQALSDKLVSSREALSGIDDAITELTSGSVRLLELIKAGARHSREDLPASMAKGEHTLASLEARVNQLRDTLGDAEARGEAMATHVGSAREQLAATIAELGDAHNAIAARGAEAGATFDDLRGTLGDINEQSAALAEQAQAELRSAIEQLSTAAREAVDGIETLGAERVARLADKLGEDSAAALDRTLRARSAEAIGQIEQAAAHAAGVGREAAIQLRDQLAKVDELAGNLERRVAQARERAAEQVDNDFARRVALITESLNSNAIDIARALSVDVTDTAWAAYLRGDRGVFTRRAVRLLEPGEAKSVVQLYENDRDFRGHVARYIHDFEAMLRQLLSTRDGHALGVTLLSSDMGKLYVALAQAIERLRA